MRKGKEQNLRGLYIISHEEVGTVVAGVFFFVCSRFTDLGRDGSLSSADDVD